MGSSISWFRGLRFKFLLLVAVPALVMGGLVVFSRSGLSILSESLARISNVRAPLVYYAGEMAISVNLAGRSIWAGYVTPVDDQQTRTFFVKATRDAVARFEEAFTEYKKIPQVPELLEKFKPVEESAVAFIKHAQEAAALLEKNSKPENDQVKEVFVGKLRAPIVTIDKVLHDISVGRLALMTKEAASDTKSSSTLQTWMGLLAIGALALLIGMGVFLARQLVSSLTEVSQRLSVAGDALLGGSSQLGAASQQVSAGTTEAAASLEETVASLEELSSMVKANAESAGRAAQESEKSGAAASKGEVELNALIQSIQEISVSSKKIEEIISVVDDIAFQTNLLALNAAVEAARAGEQGKGFAVVAEAVRSLAQRSASAAKDISSLIKETVQRVETGNDTAGRSGEVLREIVASVNNVMNLNKEISVASSEQANGIAQISKAVTQLDQATQQNAAASEEVAATAESTSKQAQDLQAVVSQLLLVVEGGGGGRVLKGEESKRDSSRGTSPKSSVSGPRKVTSSKDVIPFDEHEKVA